MNRNRLLDKLELPNSLRPADGITKHQQVTTWTPKGPQSGCQGRVSGKRQFRAQIKEGNVTQTRPHTDSKTVPEQPPNDPRTTPTHLARAPAAGPSVGVVRGSCGGCSGTVLESVWGLVWMIFPSLICAQNGRFQKHDGQPTYVIIPIIHTKISF